MRDDTRSNALRHESILFQLMNFAELIGASEHHPGYNTYRIEFPNKGIGFIITARQIPRAGLAAGEEWGILSAYTYNA